MNTVWKMSMVVALGLAVSVSGCGTSPTAACSASTCATGCCDANGQCVDGRTTAACGTGGQRCESCMTGMQCSLGTCGGGTAAGTCAEPIVLELVDFGSPGKLRAVTEGTTVGATDSEGDALSSCGGDGAADRTYQVDVPANVMLSVKAIRSGTWQPMVKLRSRACTEPDDVCAVASAQSTTASVDRLVSQATTYRITVDGAAQTQGAFELQLETRSP